MEEQGLESCLDINYESSDVYDKEISLTLIPISIYQVYTTDPMLFWIETGAPISCIGETAPMRIIYSVGRYSILIIQSYKYFQFGAIDIKSNGIV